MRLIDADEIKKSSQGIVWEEWLDMRPTIDAVPVVRCKDCLYAFDKNGHIECWHGVYYRNTYNEPDMFCSYGKRKEVNT